MLVVDSCGDCGELVVLQKLGGLDELDVPLDAGPAAGKEEFLLLRRCFVDAPAGGTLVGLGEVDNKMANLVPFFLERLLLICANKGPGGADDRTLKERDDLVLLGPPLVARRRTKDRPLQVEDDAVLGPCVGDPFGHDALDLVVGITSDELQVVRD